MVRTVISLEDDDKRWLEERAVQEGVSVTDLIRRAVRLLREHSRPCQPELNDLLERTAGFWRQGDGLEYQKRVRGEW